MDPPSHQAATIADTVGIEVKIAYQNYWQTNQEKVKDGEEGATSRG